MGSWDELDARYEPDGLTPALAFVVAMTHMAGADDVYLREEEGSLGAFLPRNGLGTMTYNELFERALAYLNRTTIDQFLAEAPPLLNQEQKLCILINMLDAALADGDYAPQEKDIFVRTREAFAIAPDVLQPYIDCIHLKHNLGLFQQ
ncbi:MAG: TerB family tellurite resistance protein [Chloroflexaceae bacterium]|nr:TerB family tellurite resistance protein [Chloroflexaceae bacterium]NJL33045.1 TerB family tellurite resistance protein [Chloroflexaceae bacterium]NJO07033.1 TerB family tellurite resistance protein [Chloroflexaceae bacterium]